MSGLFQGLFKGRADAPASSGDADFVDFAGAPEQQQQQQQPITGAAAPSPPSPGQPDTAAGTVTGVPYTKWYRIWERTSPRDFKQEAFVLPFVILVIIFHVWGTRKNRRKAKSWVQAHLPTLESEFAMVGYGGVPNTSSSASSSTTLSDAKSSDFEVPADVLREDAVDEYATYASGRQNLAFVDISIKMLKRNNPPLVIGETLIGLFFESFAQPKERIEATAYAFDGKEKEFVPSAPGDQEQKGKTGGNSTYDGFVFAIVHKSRMRTLRQDRYDVSLTFAKDSPKLPDSVTVMSESAEITDSLLTQELVKAVEQAGDLFDYLLITDQPMEKPTTIDETTPRKRIILSLGVPSSTSPAAYEASLPLFQYFIRLADRLVTVARFRQEVTRKLRSTREEEIKKLRRASEDDKIEERKVAAEKVKKEERERLLRTMSAEEQRKYLEKEKGREKKKEMKKGTRKG